MPSIPKPHPKQLEVLKDDHRYKVLNWGRRSGKSTLAGEITLTEAIKHQGRYFIVAPTYRQAKSIYWNDILKTIIPPGLISKQNDTELYVELHHLEGDVILPSGEKVFIEHNTNLPNSRIELKGADNPDSLRGVGLSGVVLDEYAFMDKGKEIWDKIIRPALGDKQGWAIFISTPNGTHNHFHELVLKAQRNDMYFYSHATALDNTYFPKEEFEIARQETPEDEFMQEWMADFRSLTTAVYPMFSREVHVIKPKDIPINGTRAIGIDPGSTDPFAVVFVMIDSDMNWYIYDMIYERKATLNHVVDMMHAKMGDEYFSRIIGDSAAALELDTLRREFNLPVTAARKGKDSLKAGIREINGKLKVREGTGKPKLFVSQNCGDLIREFESYEYTTTMDAFGNKMIMETPVDRDNHALDALRYIILDNVEHRKPRVRRQRKFDPITGRSLS